MQITIHTHYITVILHWFLPSSLSSIVTTVVLSPLTITCEGKVLVSIASLNVSSSSNTLSSVMLTLNPVTVVLGGKETLYVPFA